ncbi:hypothetical protein CC1G_04393 [Coprinopsis cinerea okayama7|uniref:SGT1-domain-containing protein n=1 Tax=Coprinopsis cinerea (strain Okayama-7 / 130 / ATCC MYA-4618 / FGSC 9003) TaxID=240176 RepID=A8N0H2_COPC7|nr:hypothetical protein CC1G_04393 [Coprinopsis cinerea okayama7\|eukprot:XP_001828422.2 hypothetical protein CC1G_04393 [Coprinopsis cinerea okayama7\
MQGISTISDIFNRPPSIAEDTLQYTIYPPAAQSDKSSVTTFAACIQSFVQDLLVESKFLWHRDAFEVKVVPNPYYTRPPKDKDKKDGEGEPEYILEGRMRVGDCVDDEWCVVWLLREVSSKWDLAVSVFDSDGEFLLIEAAEALPPWVQPSNSENRVWIYKSRLHLIPLSFISPPSSKKHPRRKLPGRGARGSGGGSDNEDNLNEDDDDEFISVPDALKAIRDPLCQTFAPKGVEEIVWNRISSYPEALKNHVHRTKAYIPADVAKALHHNPALVQRAVETFYTRDAIQLRAAHKMTRFPPPTTALHTVTLTRTAYAQLQGQKFHPPKVFGRWEEREGTREWRWRDVGMKISEAIKDSLRNNPDYLTYIQNLLSTGYFRDEIEGSEKWKELETKAALTFVEVRRADDATRPSFATQVDSAIAQVVSAPPPSTVDDPEDDDAWLNIDESDFDSMLAKAMGSKGNTTTTGTSPRKGQGGEVGEGEAMDTREDGVAGGDGDADRARDEDAFASVQASRLKDLASKVEKFVEGEGDLEGARFEDELLSDEEFSDDEEEFGDGDSDDESDVGGEAMDQDDDGRQDDEHSTTTASYVKQATSRMTESERQAAMNELVAPLKEGEYGQMPARYSQSQRVKPTTIETEVVEDTRGGGVSKASSASSKDGGSTTSLDANGTKTSDEGGGGGVKPLPKTKPIRPPIIPRDKYEGVESDSSDSEPDSEDEENQPQVVGVGDGQGGEGGGEAEFIDMDEEEEEFLEFSRQALGISEEMWEGIVRDRRERGAFLPKSVLKGEKAKEKAKEKGKEKELVPPKPEPKADEPKSQRATAEGQNQANPLDPDAIFDRPKRRQPHSGPRPDANPALDSFEAVMQALDAELEKVKREKNGGGAPTKASTTQKQQQQQQSKPVFGPEPPPPPSSTANSNAKGKGKGKAKAPVSSIPPISESNENEDEEMQFDDDFDIEAAMEQELRAALERADDDESDSDVDMEGGGRRRSTSGSTGKGGEGMDYNLIKNFLESFKSQGGLAGPVGNLAGRLQPGWTLPRDQE